MLKLDDMSGFSVHNVGKGGAKYPGSLANAMLL